MGNVTPDPRGAAAELSVVSRTSSRRRRSWYWLLGALFLTSMGMVVWWPTRTMSGDPGGRILAQIVPAASALPGYNTPALPWETSPSTSGAYLIKSEPHQTSCDGRAGTFGWSSVVVQGRFPFGGTRLNLFREMESRLAALGWTGVSNVRSTDTEHMWRKRLINGSEAHAILASTPPGSASWTFVVTAPPISHASSGC